MGKHSREKRERREGGLAAQKWSGGSPVFESACLWIIKGGVFLLLFCPLIISKYSFFPFVTPKTIVFRILAEIVIGAYILLAIANSRYRPRLSSPLTIAVSAFLLILVLTSFTGINPARSFWSTYERMTGLLTLFHLYGLYIVLTSVFKTRKEWRWVLSAAVAVGVLLSFYVLLSDKASSRGGGTVGNTSFMATYLLFDVFLAIMLLLAESRPWKIYAGLALLPMLANLFTSSAQGAVISFFGGISFLLLGYLWFSKKKPLRLAVVVLILLVIFTSIVLSVLQPPFAKNRASRVWSEMQPRFAVWGAGWKAWQERFWLGWGPENFHVAFLKYFNPCMFLAQCGQEIWFDRTHNIILDTANASGLVGLASYLLVFAVSFWGLWRVCRKVTQTRNVFLPLGMAVILLTYFAQNLLVFDMISSYLMFFLSLAFIAFLSARDEEERETRRRLQPFWLVAVPAAVIFLIVFFNVKPQSAAANTAQMIARKNQDFSQITPYFQKSLDSWMLKYEPREQFVQIVSEVPPEQINDKEAAKTAFEVAVREMEKSVVENPTDFRTHLFLGRLYTNFYYFSKDAQHLERAKEVLDEALALSPTNQQGYWYLAETRFAGAKYPEAIAFLTKAITLEPQLGQSWWYLAIGYHLAGQYQDAVKAMDEAGKVSQNYDWRLKSGDIKRVISIYTALNDTAAVLSVYDEAVSRFPGDPQFWAGAAPLYAHSGQYDKARAAAQKLLELRPDLQQQVQDFLKTLPPL